MIPHLLFHKTATVSGPETVGWSTYGIVADGVTDNTAALNALPTGVNIGCDTPGIVKFSKWLLKSNMSLYLNSDCLLSSTLGSAGGFNGAVTQADLATPLTDVYITGINVERRNHTDLGQLFALYMNSSTITNWEASTYYTCMFLRGSNVEISNGVATTPVGSGSGDGGAGIRYFGNFPKVATTGGKPANVWINNNSVVSGDDAYVLSTTESVSSVWSNVSSNDILVEDNVGVSVRASFLAAGYDSNSVLFDAVEMTDITFRRNYGSGNKQGIRVLNNHNPSGTVSDILFQDISVDCTTDFDSTGSLLIKTLDTSVIEDITFDNVVITNPFSRGMDVTGNVSNLLFTNGNIGATRAGTTSTIIMRNGSGNSITNSTIGSTSNSGIQIGPNQNSSGATFIVSSPTISGNTITGITNGRFGILLQNVDGAIVENNIMTPAIGTTDSRGIKLTVNDGTNPGTTGATITGNDLTALTSSNKIACVTGQNNSVISNLGTSDCPP